MKKPFKNFAHVLILLTALSAFTNLSAKAKSQVVTIQTSAICESCKARIEKALKGTDGILSANLNLDNKKIKVKYDADKISADQIRMAIANTGYDADNVKKNPDAYGKLPHCCQKDGDHMK